MNTEEYKNKLIEEKALVEEQLNGFGAKKDPETGNWEATPDEADAPESDENDLGDKFEDYNLENEKVETLESRLSDINSALEKIQNGNYGTCEVCGGKIEEDRLAANPAARTCKACMEK